MSHFTEQLRKALARQGLPASRLAKIAGLTTGTIPAWLAGRNTPKPDTLARLIGPLPPEERAGLILAHLRDELPPGYESAVILEAAGGIVQEPPPATAWQLPDRDTLSPDLVAAIEHLVNEAMHPDLPEIRDLLISLSKALKAESKK